MSNKQYSSVKCKRWQPWLVFFCMGLVHTLAWAQRFDLPDDGSNLVGTPRIVIPQGNNTLLDIARHFDLGYHEITLANPEVDVWLPESNGKVVIPSQFILPPPPWSGVIINISQRRLFYFPKPGKGEKPYVITFPVSIAREGWSTPLGETTIVAKHKDPAWFVPKSIRQEHQAAGEGEFPEYFPPGPDNPMGMLAIGLGFKSIFIHGTNRPWGVGMRTSHGCLHLYPEDAVIFFNLINPGEKVRVIDEPVLIGIKGTQLLMSNYEPVQEYGKEYGISTQAMTHATLMLAPYLQSAVQLPPAGKTQGAPRIDVDWDRVQQVLQTYQVLPVSIALAGDSLADSLANIAPEPYTHEPFGADANNAALPDRYQSGRPDPQPGLSQ